MKRSEWLKGSEWRCVARAMAAVHPGVRCPECGGLYGYKVPNFGVAGQVQIPRHQRDGGFAGAMHCSGSFRNVALPMPPTSEAWTHDGALWKVTITGSEVSLSRDGARIVGARSELLGAIGVEPFAVLVRVAMGTIRAWWAYEMLRDAAQRVVAGAPNAIDMLEEVLAALPAARREPGALATLASRVLLQVREVRVVALVHVATCPHHECEGATTCDGGPGMRGCKSRGTACSCGAVKAQEEIDALCQLASDLAQTTGGQ